MEFKEFSFSILEDQLQKKNLNISSDRDLLSLLIEKLCIRKDIELWEDLILSYYGSFPALLSAPAQEIKAILKLQNKEIANIKLMHDAALRLLKSKIYNCNILINKQFLTEYLIASLSRESIEYFFVFFLDEEGNIMKEECHGRGTVNATSVHIREITRSALKLKAFALILVHNHPGGNPSPSQADQELTQIIVEALKVVNIIVVDHLVIGNGNYFSFRERSLLV